MPGMQGVDGLMQGFELPSATDREGREMRRDYDRRKTVELALEVAREYRLSKFDGPMDEWMRTVNLPPHRLWEVKEEVKDDE